MTDLGANVRAVAGAVTHPDDLNRLFATVDWERGKLNILFANAGTGALAPLAVATR